MSHHHPSDSPSLGFAPPSPDSPHADLDQDSDRRHSVAAKSFSSDSHSGGHSPPSTPPTSVRHLSTARDDKKDPQRKRKVSIFRSLSAAHRPAPSPPRTPRRVSEEPLGRPVPMAIQDPSRAGDDHERKKHAGGSFQHSASAVAHAAHDLFHPHHRSRHQAHHRESVDSPTPSPQFPSVPVASPEPIDSPSPPTKHHHHHPSLSGSFRRVRSALSPKASTKSRASDEARSEGGSSVDGERLARKLSQPGADDVASLTDSTRGGSGTWPRSQRPGSDGVRRSITISGSNLLPVTRGGSSNSDSMRRSSWHPDREPSSPRQPLEEPEADGKGRRDSSPHRSESSGGSVSKVQPRHVRHSFHLSRAFSSPPHQSSSFATVPADSRPAALPVAERPRSYAGLDTRTLFYKFGPEGYPRDAPQPLEGRAQDKRSRSPSPTGRRQRTNSRLRALSFSRSEGRRAGSSSSSGKAIFTAEENADAEVDPPVATEKHQTAPSPSPRKHLEPRDDWAKEGRARRRSRQRDEEQDDEDDEDDFEEQHQPGGELQRHFDDLLNEAESPTMAPTQGSPLKEVLELDEDSASEDEGRKLPSVESVDTEDVELLVLANRLSKGQAVTANDVAAPLADAAHGVGSHEAEGPGDTIPSHEASVGTQDPTEDGPTSGPGSFILVEHDNHSKDQQDPPQTTASDPIDITPLPDDTSPDSREPTSPRAGHVPTPDSSRSPPLSYNTRARARLPSSHKYNTHRRPNAKEDDPTGEEDGGMAELAWTLASTVTVATIAGVLIVV